MSELADYLIARHAETLRKRAGWVATSPTDRPPPGVDSPGCVDVNAPPPGGLYGPDGVALALVAPAPDEPCPDEVEGNAATAGVTVPIGGNHA